MHRKKTARQRFPGAQMIAAAALTLAVIALLALAGLTGKPSTGEAGPHADADRPAVASESGVISPPTAAAPRTLPPTKAPPLFASDDKGFIDSSARCQGSSPARAIGRTPGSLVVICGEQSGQYEYLGVRLSDAAILRTKAEFDSARSFLARSAGVVYQVSPQELKVTNGNAVIKQEPMIEYRELF